MKIEWLISIIIESFKKKYIIKKRCIDWLIISCKEKYKEKNERKYWNQLIKRYKIKDKEKSKERYKD